MRVIAPFGNPGGGIIAPPVHVPHHGIVISWDSVNDFTDDGHDDVIVVDVVRGALLDRVDTGSRITNGMFLTAGGRRDVFYCTTTVFARIAWS